MEPERDTAKRASRFSSLPSTITGKWSAGLLLLSLVLILLNMLPPAEQGAGPEWPQAVFNLVTFLCVVSAGVCGLIALVMKRERSWAVIVAVLLFLLVVGFELAEFLSAWLARVRRI